MGAGLEGTHHELHLPALLPHGFAVVAGFDGFAFAETSGVLVSAVVHSAVLECASLDGGVLCVLEHRVVHFELWGIGILDVGLVFTHLFGLFIGRFGTTGLTHFEEGGVFGLHFLALSAFWDGLDSHEIELVMFDVL